MSHEGRGVAHINDKTIFIDGALPEEEVSFIYTGMHRNYDEGKAVEVLKSSPDRVEPLCEHFGLCGGCSLQHLNPKKQIEYKQETLMENLRRMGHVTPEEILPPLVASQWGYRRKARIGVRYVHKKERVMVGFREKGNRYLADLHGCKVLHPSVGEHIDDLSKVIASLESYDQIAQIEVAATDSFTALVFRNLVSLSDSDQEKLKNFAREFNFHVYLQSAGPDSVSLLYPDESVLSYTLGDFNLDLQFLPTDFTQVNAEINQKMIVRALDLLQVNEQDRVLDLFCGIGNFTLPLATRVAHVTGVEGDVGLIDRARANAERNHLLNVDFHVNDLTNDLVGTTWADQQYDKILLDPPRSGALEIMDLVAGLNASRIVYVSCHPASLSRDAGELVNRYGYTLVKAGVMDMFPHTAHVESIALFEKRK
jgi:23S rRNA (uracil1939-C5)-methyltransferase